MAQVEVTYLCWGCGALESKVEDIELSQPVTALEQWNICPECIKKQGVKNENHIQK